MFKICDESDLLTVTTVTYLLSVVSFGAFIFTTIGHAVTVPVNIALLFTLLVSAALLHTATLALPGAGPTARAWAVIGSHVFLNIANMFVTDFGFLATLSYSLLAAAVGFVGKLADGTDKRFVTLSATAGLLRGFFWTVESKEYASAVCLLIVFVVTSVVHLSGVERGRGGYPYVCYKADYWTVSK